MTSPAISDNSDVRPSLLRVWFLALRPKTLTASLGPALLGCALAAADGVWSPAPAMVFLFGFVLLQLVANLVNDYADFERGADTEERLGPARVTQKGWLTAREVARAAWLAFVGSAAALLYLGYGLGWPVLLAGGFCLAGAVLYTAGPVPLGYLGLGDILVFLIFGVAGVCGSYYVQTQHLTREVVLSSLAMGSLATAILVVNNLRDRKTDERAGKITLVVRFGQRFGQVEYTVSVVGAFVLAGLICGLSSERRLGWLLPLLALPLAVKEIKAIWREDGAALNPHLGKTALLGLVFAILLSVGALLSK